MVGNRHAPHHASSHRFFRSDSIALPALDWLAGQGSGVAEIVGVFTRPDRPHGRGPASGAQRHQAVGARAWPARAAAGETHARCAGDPARAAARRRARHGLRPPPAAGLARCAAARFLEPARLAAARAARRVAHPGAIAGGHAESGVCLMRVVLALDAGPVLDRERVALDPLETGATLVAKLAAACRAACRPRPAQGAGTRATPWSGTGRLAGHPHAPPAQGGWPAGLQRAGASARAADQRALPVAGRRLCARARGNQGRTRRCGRDSGSRCTGRGFARRERRMRSCGHRGGFSPVVAPAATRRSDAGGRRVLARTPDRRGHGAAVRADVGTGRLATVQRMMLSPANP
ncbi:MAG: hypothetical protein MZV63_19630 [Marinilabiliales bacterium]|nr:hypothetical protein [Marinilabiliales bacterium]